MSMALIGLSMLVDKWVNKKKLLLFIGQNSLTILYVHGTILLAASKVLPRVGLTGVDDSRDSVVCDCNCRINTGNFAYQTLCA